GAGDVRRDVGGVAQWIPSLDKAGAARVCIIGGRAARGYTRVAQGVAGVLTQPKRLCLRPNIAPPGDWNGLLAVSRSRRASPRRCPLWARCHGLQSARLAEFCPA